MAKRMDREASPNSFNRRDVLALAAGTAVGLAMPGSATAETAQPVKGGAFRFTVLDGNPGNTLDPGVVNTWADNILHSLLFAPLVTIGPDGLPAPVLAEPCEPDAIGKTWTIRLRNARWHDGKPLSAEDLAFTLKRTVD